jgi:hypothetical protein
MFGRRLLAKINELKSWQVFLIIAFVGLVVFATGLPGQFQGDDSVQIVNNPIAHSISNIGEFFKSSTDYNEHTHALSSTGYYRPLMTTVFSLIYTVFGAESTAFHIVQLIIYISSAFLLYLIFRYYFRTTLALFLALVFLVHPINSQVVYSIPCMQDALYFFFGILAMWILMSYDSLKSIILVALCLFLSELSKEAGFFFVVMALIYILWFIKGWLGKIVATGIIIFPSLIYLIIRLNTVSFGPQNIIAPIDLLKLTSRLMTAPSIVQFYLTKLIFPWKLATFYYWTYSTFSLRNVLLPILIDAIVVGGFIYVGKLVRKKAPKGLSDMYIFFGLWTVIGIIPYLQFAPLDMTACEAWFYFAMAGLLGMIGVILKTYPLHISPTKLLTISIILISLLGVRSTIRGLDYANQLTLSSVDVSNSKQDYFAYGQLAEYYVKSSPGYSNYYAEQSVRFFPNVPAYNLLGVIFINSQTNHLETEIMKSSNYNCTTASQPVSYNSYLIEVIYDASNRDYISCQQPKGKNSSKGVDVYSWGK